MQKKITRQVRPKAKSTRIPSRRMKTLYGLHPTKDAVRYYGGGQAMSDFGHAMFVIGEKESRVDHYGYGKNVNRYTFDRSLGTNIISLKSKIKTQWKKDNEDGSTPIDYEHYSPDIIFKSFCPDDIVDSAEGWDSGELTQWIWERVLEPLNIMAINTPDGSIVFDKNLIRNWGNAKIFLKNL